MLKTSSEGHAPIPSAVIPALVAGSSDIALVCDGRGTIVAASGEIGELLGRRRDPILGHALTELAIPEDERAVHHAFTDARDGGGATFTIHLRSEGGPPVQARIDGWSVGGDGAPVTLYLVKYDRHQREEERALLLADTQRTIATVLALALEDIPLDDLLGRTLDLILATPWLSIERKGAIFLVDQERKTLVMRVHRGLAPDLLSSCARVQLGSCLCGQAALHGTAIYVGNLDARHTTRYAGIAPHGHYCVPIRGDAGVLGVITTYLAPEHERSEVELEFLTAVANTLAGVLARRRANAERQQAEDASRRKSEFLALVSHELLTPVTAALLSCERLERDRAVPLAPRHVEVVSRMEDALGRLASTIRLLLEHARLEVACPLARRDCVDLSALARSVVEEVRPLAERKGLTARFALESPVPPLQSDERLLRLVLANLVANAVKFTTAGSISVRVGYRDGAHRVAVEDTGPGIPPAERGRIFDAFEPLGPLANKHVPGMGLGLPLARRLAIALGAVLELDSSSGAGSTFVVTLPDQASAASAQVLAPA